MATEEIKNTNPAHKEFQSLLEQDFKDRKLKENQIIKATVSEITKNFIVVDCKAKMEGMIPVEEFKNDNEFEQYEAKARLNMINKIYQSYDENANQKYKVDVNQKTVDRVKNSFQ